MRRREFIALLGGAAAWPLAARAQQPAMPVIGFLSTRSQKESVDHTAAFLAGIGESGYIEHRDVIIEYRWSEGRYDRLPALAAELVAARVSVIAAGGDPSAIAAKAATKTIPITFIIGDDPVRLGLVASLNRPNGNASGVSLITTAMGAKRLELLHQMVPSAQVVALLVNPTNPNAEAHLQEVETAANVLNLGLVVVRASNPAELELSFEALSGSGARALVVHNDPFFDTLRHQLVSLSARYAIAAIYHIREFPAAAGLMSYGPSLAEGYRQFGTQTGKVLRGASPSDLPVVRPTKFELAINLRVANLLGLIVPSSLLVAADEVIE